MGFLWQKMRIVAKYSHLNGYEWLLHHHPNLWGEIEEAIKAVDALLVDRVSKEKTMVGKVLFAPEK